MPLFRRNDKTFRKHFSCLAIHLYTVYVCGCFKKKYMIPGLVRGFSVTLLQKEMIFMRYKSDKITNTTLLLNEI